MFFIFFGTYKFLTDAKSEKQGCSKCGGTLKIGTGWFWFHIFFIPIFPYKKVDNFAQCNNCNSKFTIHTTRRFTAARPQFFLGNPAQNEEKYKERRVENIEYSGICKECGEKLIKNKIFCMKCGAILEQLY